MKRTLLLAVAALGAASSLVATKAQAQSAGIIAPGTLIPGVSLPKGTITYSNQTGTRDSFSVGMSTNIGANVSASSTSDYNSSGTALFGLNGTSNLRQEIGTSRTTDQSFAQLQSYQQEASSSAAISASSDSSVTQGWGISSARKDGKGVAITDTSSDAYTKWESNRNNSSEYKSAYASSYESAYTAAASSSYGSGVISGTFEKNAGKTVNSTVTSGSTAITDSVKTQAQNSATTTTNAEYGSTYASRGGTYTAMSESEWTTARTNAYDASYSKAINTLASGSVINTTEQTAATTNEVEVRGVGSTANLTTNSSSKFEAGITRATNTVVKVDNTVANVVTTTTTNNVGAASGTASASAGGNLSSSSYADANSTTFTSSFVQAY